MNKYRNNNQERFYYLLIELSLNEEKRKSRLPVVAKFLETIHHEFKEIDYPTIFSIAYDSDITREELELLLQVLVDLEKQITNDEYKRTIQKMRRHFLLSFEQKQRIVNEVKSSEQTLVEVQSQLLDVEDRLKDSYEILEELQNDSSSIYIQFVTILGVFTAIVFSIFGGLTLLDFSVSALNSIPTWKAIVFFSLFSIVTMTMLFMLMRWISIIIDNVTGRRRKFKAMKILSSHFGYTVSVIFFMYLIFISILFSNQSVFLNFQNWIAEISNYLILGFVLLLPILIFSLFLIVYLYNNKATARNRVVALLSTFNS